MSLKQQNKLVNMFYCKGYCCLALHSQNNTQAGIIIAHTDNVTFVCKSVSGIDDGFMKVRNVNRYILVLLITFMAEPFLNIDKHFVHDISKKLIAIKIVYQVA